MEAFRLTVCHVCLRLEVATLRRTWRVSRRWFVWEEGSLLLLLLLLLLLFLRLLSRAMNE